MTQRESNPNLGELIGTDTSRFTGRQLIEITKGEETTIPRINISTISGVKVLDGWVEISTSPSDSLDVRVDARAITDIEPGDIWTTRRDDFSIDTIGICMPPPKSTPLSQDLDFPELY